MYRTTVWAQAQTAPQANEGANRPMSSPDGEFAKARGSRATSTASGMYRFNSRFSSVRVRVRCLCCVEGSFPDRPVAEKNCRLSRLRRLSKAARAGGRAPVAAPLYSGAQPRPEAGTSRVLALPPPGVSPIERATLCYLRLLRLRGLIERPV